MTILKFSFTVVAKSREEALEEIDSQVREMMSRLSGEPWLTVVDDVRKIPMAGKIFDPDSYVYIANREVIFGGPTVMGDFPGWRDGFRPQDQSDTGFIF